MTDAINIFTVNANRQDPMIIPAVFRKLRIWRDTAVVNLRDGEQLVLGNGMLGHEWDEDLDNGFRPAGLIRLSETTIDGVPYPTDAGSVYDTGTATHSLTLYRAKKRRAGVRRRLRSIQLGAGRFPRQPDGSR